MKRTFRLIALFIFLLSMFGSISQVYAQNGEEQRLNKLKAAFVLNFARFTVWPEHTLSQNDEFTLCVLGDDPIGDAFAGVESKRIAAKPIRVIRTSDIDQALKCNLVYISNSVRDSLDKFLNEFAGYPILLVSDIEYFAEFGGTIEFSTLNRRLGFNINNSKAKQNELKINSSLLDLASKVF